MKIVIMINLVLLTLLSLASGVAKVMLQPQEIAFFGGAGFSEAMIVVFGVAQLIGGAILALKKVRKLGAIIMALTFGVSSALIFMSGNVTFGLISMLPILMAGVVIKGSTKPQA